MHWQSHGDRARGASSSRQVQRRSWRVAVEIGVGNNAGRVRPRCWTRRRRTRVTAGAWTEALAGRAASLRPPPPSPTHCGAITYRASRAFLRRSSAAVRQAGWRGRHWGWWEGKGKGGGVAQRQAGRQGPIGTGQHEQFVNCAGGPAPGRPPARARLGRRQSGGRQGFGRQAECFSDGTKSVWGAAVPRPRARPEGPRAGV